MDNTHNFVRQWNYRFPVDYWWRKKHKVAFNSPEHRNSSFWDMMFEFYEDKMYETFKIEKPYEPDEGDWLNIKEKEVKTIDDGIEDAMEELQKYKEMLEKSS